MYNSLNLPASVGHKGNLLPTKPKKLVLTGYALKMNSKMFKDKVQPSA
jgi:hypothetical protein